MLAGAYARFRSSTAFLCALAAFVAVWITAHNLIGLDPDWGMLNLILSIEASFSVALLIMAGNKQEAAQQQQLVHMRDLLEAVVSMLKERRDVGRDSASGALAGEGVSNAG